MSLGEVEQLFVPLHSDPLTARQTVCPWYLSVPESERGLRGLRGVCGTGSRGRSVVRSRSRTFSAASRRDGSGEYTATSARVTINNSGSPPSAAPVTRIGTSSPG